MFFGDKRIAERIILIAIFKQRVRKRRAFFNAQPL